MRIKALFGMIVAVFVAAGCSTPQPIPVLPDIRYTGLPPINLDVGSIAVESDYVAPFKSPNIEHVMPVSPEKLARTWAADRLRTVGSGSRTARFIIKDASVVETSLKTDGGFTGVFKKEQSERYEGKLDVVLEIRDEHGRVVGEASASAGRMRTVGEDITIAEREGIWRDISKSLVDEVNTLLEGNMRRYIAKYLVL